MASLLGGREVAAVIQQEVAEDVVSLRQSFGVTPTLAVLLSGEDPASKVSVGRKRQAAKALGIQTRDHIFPGGLSEQDTIALVRDLNGDKGVHGILVQLPLPKDVSEERTFEALDPARMSTAFILRTSGV